MAFPVGALVPAEEQLMHTPKL